jgi:hypothetical protein
MIGQEDAASALASVDTARRRATELRSYAHAGDILIAWGLVWLIGNLASWYEPTWSPWVWPVGIAAAALFSMLRGRVGHGRFDWRVLGTVLAGLGLFAATVVLNGPANPHKYDVLIVLFVATAYVVLGIWAGQRFAWTGLAMAAVALLGWNYDRGHLLLWLGFGGGGALILSGLWLRRA